MTRKSFDEKRRVRRQSGFFATRIGYLYVKLSGFNHNLIQRIVYVKTLNI